jgi:homoserine kinase
MGPGFDCMGMAFKLYNTLRIETQESGLLIENWSDQTIPTYSNNLIYATIKDFFNLIGKKLPGLHMIQDDHIPMTRGLGSSAACIVSGLLAANELSGERLSREQLLKIAAETEGHPDNAAPALFGGITVGAMHHGQLYYSRLNVPKLNELHFAVIIPNFYLSTEKARKILPTHYTRADAVYNISRAALLTAALTGGDFELLRAAFGDRIHQPYRRELIPGFKEIFDAAYASGALGVFLSGAGPTIIAVTTSNTIRIPVPDDWILSFLKPDQNGARLEICSS